MSAPILPSRSPWDYPTHAGPGAHYPAEANVPPVWLGGGTQDPPSIESPDIAYVDQPPAEHTTRDPWPEGFAVPDVVEDLRVRAQVRDWRTATGYSRAYEKRGRGNVGGTGDARWVLRHFVAVQVRRPGMKTQLMSRVIYGADVGSDPLEWTVTSVQVAGKPSNITGFRKLIRGSAL